MKKILISIYDRKADRYGFIQTVDHLIDAERSLLNVIANDQRSPVAMYPQDFAMYHLGSFDLADGSIESLPKPKLIAAVDEILAAAKASDFYSATNS